MTTPTKALETEPQTNEQRQDEARRAEYRLAFARSWMQRVREEQQNAEENFKNDPVLVAAFEELKRRNRQRGTCLAD